MWLCSFLRGKLKDLDNYRYLMDFDTDKIRKEYYDVIIIGSGIAGVYTALELPDKYKVVILTKETIDISNSVLAQGGIAVSLDKEDSPELHFKDTLYAGAGLCDENSVWVLVNEAAQNIESLCKFGVNFDKKKIGMNCHLPGRVLTVKTELFMLEILQVKKFVTN